MESHTDLWLATDKGHLVHRVVQRSFVVGKSAGREEEWNVVKWLTLNEGTSFPLEVERLIQRSDKTPIARHRWIVDEQELVINSDIPGDAFLFSFPKNAIVRRFPLVDGKIRAELWGGNDQPLRTFPGRSGVCAEFEFGSSYYCHADADSFDSDHNWVLLLVPTTAA